MDRKEDGRGTTLYPNEYPSCCSVIVEKGGARSACACASFSLNGRIICKWQIPAQRECRAAAVPSNRYSKNRSMRHSPSHDMTYTIIKKPQLYD